VPEPDSPLTKEEIEKYRRELSLLSTDRVEYYYQQAPWKECQLQQDQVPPVRAIQELVTAWKLLWKWNRPRR